MIWVAWLVTHYDYEGASEPTFLYAGTDPGEIMALAEFDLDMPPRYGWRWEDDGEFRCGVVAGVGWD